jgi:hypothetical protein
VHAPQIGEAGGVEPLLATFGRLTEGVSRLPNIVLEQPGLSEGTSNLKLLVAMEPWLPQGANKQGGRFDTSPSFKRSRCLTVEIGRCHGA